MATMMPNRLRRKPSREERKGTLNVPNLFTVFRFCLIPLYLYVFFTGHPKTALGVILLAGGTDVLDGYLARRRGEATALGALLDPLADKLMMLAIVVSLLWKQWIPWQAAALVAMRDIGMILGSAIFHLRGKSTVRANWMGKLTTLCFYISIVLIFFGSPFALPLLWATIALSIVTSVIYLILVYHINRQSKKSV